MVSIGVAGDGDFGVGPREKSMTGFIRFDRTAAQTPLTRAMLLVGAFLVCVTNTFAQSRSGDFVAEHGQLSVSGTQLVDSAGAPIVLRGMSFGWHVWWPQFWNADVVSWLRDDWNCTVLRAAMGIEPRGGYLQSSEEAKQIVKTVVDACIQNGMYVIIDWHDHNASKHLDESKEFFVEMAQTYGAHPNVIYEIYNEPEGDTWEEVKQYAESIIAAIREVDPDNIILVGSPHWDQDVHLAADDPIDGVANVMYALHFYAGTHKQSLRDNADYALSKGLPLFVSEYGGCEASGLGKLDLPEWDRWVKWMEDRKISWCKWCIGDKEETCAALIPRARSTGGWSQSDLTHSGVYVRNLLRRLNQAPVTPSSGE